MDNLVVNTVMTNAVNAEFEYHASRISTRVTNTALKTTWNHDSLHEYKPPLLSGCGHDWRLTSGSTMPEHVMKMSVNAKLAYLASSRRTPCE
jgi:hypothetical protein